MIFPPKPNPVGPVPTQYQNLPQYNYDPTGGQAIPQGANTVPLNASQSNLYNSLLDYYNQSSPGGAAAAEEQMARNAGTYSDSPQFKAALKAQTDAATSSAASPNESSSLMALYQAAGLVPPSSITPESAQQTLKDLASQTQAMQGYELQNIPSTGVGLGGKKTDPGYQTIQDSIQPAGTKTNGNQYANATPFYYSRPAIGTPSVVNGADSGDYEGQLNNVLAQYTQIPQYQNPTPKTPSKQGQSTAVDQLRQYYLQQKANALRQKLGQSAAPGGII